MTNCKNDSPSQISQFGWERVGNDQLAIPVILRCDGVRYSPVRIVEQEIIKRYENLPHLVFQCITLKSFYLTTTEAKLLNNINFNHCENRYGEVFFNTKDVIISAEDAKGISRFLNISNIVFNKDLTQLCDKLGVIRIQPDPENSSMKSLIPYITRGRSYTQSDVNFIGDNANLSNEAVKNTDGQLRRFVPAKLVEPYLRSSGLQAAPNDWDIMYLKMLCMYSEINPALYPKRDDRLVCLHELRYASTNTPVLYEEYKPMG